MLTTERVEAIRALAYGETGPLADALAEILGEVREIQRHANAARAALRVALKSDPPAAAAITGALKHLDQLAGSVRESLGRSVAQ